MLLEKNYLPERLKALHRHDSSSLYGYDYSKDILIRSISKKIMLSNNNFAEFVLEIQKIATMFIDQGYHVRNFWDFTVDKNYNKHSV